MPIKSGDKPVKENVEKAPAWKVQVGVLPVMKDSGVMVDIEPRDAESRSGRTPPARFMCDDGVSYRLVAPKTVGYAAFKHWSDQATGKVITESNELTRVFTGDASLVATYDRRVPCDVIIESANPTSGVKVTASLPDISGRTEIVTPGNFTYLSGTKVIFDVQPEFVRTNHSPLKRVADETYVFQGWRRLVDWISRVTTLEHQVDGHGEKLQVAYTHTPPPWSPGATQLQAMDQQMKFAVQAKADSDDIVILWNNEPVQAFNQFLFKSEVVARAVARRLFLSTYKDWLARLPADQAEWASKRGNMDAFLDYWLENRLKFMPYSAFIAETHETKRGSTDAKTLKARN